MEKPVDKVTKVSSPSPCMESPAWDRACVCCMCARAGARVSVLAGDPGKGLVCSPSILWDTQERSSSGHRSPFRQSPKSPDSQHREHRAAEKEEKSSGEDLGCLASGHDTNSRVTLAKSLLLHTCFPPPQ